MIRKGQWQSIRKGRPGVRSRNTLLRGLKDTPQKCQSKPETRSNLSLFPGLSAKKKWTGGER